MRRADISLLFDFFVTSQRIRRVLGDALADAGMRPDEYAVYSLLLEEGPLTATAMAEILGMPLTTVLDYLKALERAGHMVRTAHPFDGRATEVSLNRSGLEAQRRAHRHWEVVRKAIEDDLTVPIGKLRRSLLALDDSVQRAGLQLKRKQARAARRASG